MDLVLLHHAQDFSPHPHQVLREAARVLRGGGNLVLIGFNPLSLWGMRKLISRSRTGPWGGRFLLPGRMEDWLTLLDFAVEDRHCRFYRPPLRRFAGIRGKARKGPGKAIRLLPLGAYYCILATKQVGAPVRKRPAWRQQPVRLPGAVGACNRYSENGNH
jgi:SAM-dependent methyltransferase